MLDLARVACGREGGQRREEEKRKASPVGGVVGGQDKALLDPERPRGGCGGP